MSVAQQGPRTKATGIDWLRGLIEKRGPAAEQELSRALAPADLGVFRSALAMSWIRVETTVRIYEACGPILFPGEEDVLFELGREMAKANLTTIYRALIRIATVPRVLSQSARLWRIYHDTGTASASPGTGAKEVVFVVRGYPACPPQLRKVLRGYMAGLGELVGIRSPRVVLDESDPSAWKWTITWT